MNIIKQQNGIAVIEDNGGFFCVGLSRDMQVSSLGQDNPDQRGCVWVANYSPSGLNYVSRPRSRASAMAMLRRMQINTR